MAVSYNKPPRDRVSYVADSLERKHFGEAPDKASRPSASATRQISPPLILSLLLLPVKLSVAGNFLFVSRIVGWRLSLLKAIVAIGFCCAILILVVISASNSSFAAEATSSQEHRLRLYHTHTGEHIDVVYRRGEVYLPKRKTSSTISCAIIAPGTSSTTIHGSSTFFPMRLRRSGIRARRSRSFAGTGPRGATNYFVPVLPGWRRTASTCRPTPLIFAFQGSIR